jgi:phosphoribosyl-ATP pyrophosphohydrolase/phosphoribosyl-AMP cyclohydrolase
MINQNQKLVPAIVQDYSSKTILMLGYMNIEAINKTLEGPNVWFYSRSRQSLWEKGETSGNYLKFVSMHVDCDQDALLIIVKPIGPTCHSGETSCFEKSEKKSQIKLNTMKNNLKNSNQSHYEILSELFSVIKNRHQNPQKDSYTSKLFEEGPEKISKKLIEESGETIIEFLDTNRKTNDLLINEISDLLFHLLVLIESADIKLEEVLEELSKRRKIKHE